MWEPSNKLIKFVPGLDFSDPSYHLPHFYELCSAADKKMGRRFRGEFKSAAKELTLRSIESLHGDVKHFCDMFDYRNNGENADWGNSRDSLERAVLFLTSYDPEER